MKKAEKQEKVWDWDTGEIGLIRNRESGRYYSRIQVKGVRTMRALKTDMKSVALLRHRDQLAAATRQRVMSAGLEAGRVTMGPLLTMAAEAYRSNSTLTDHSKEAFASSVERLTTQWAKCFGQPLAGVKPERVTQATVATFANFLHTNAEWRRANFKAARRGYGAVTVNTTVETLHRVLRLAKERKLIFDLPFELGGGLEGSGLHKPEPRKVIRFPSRDKIREVFKQMRTVRDDLPENQKDLRLYLVDRANESADLAEFMAYSGARVTEAVCWTWEDERETTIFIRGTKTETSENREIDKIRPLADLLEQMKERRNEQGRPLHGRVFRIAECRDALASACKRAGVDRWTHHTLRHLFATICIESAVDIPTVAKWLGHADGGALAMKTYGHLRKEHGAVQAAKVTF